MKKTCKRKHYPLINCIDMAMEGAAIVQDKAMVNLRIRELAAIESFAKGQATIQDWSDVAAMLNLCEGMARAGVGREALPVCGEAQAHLIEATKRYESTGRMGLAGLGIQALRNLYEYHELQRTSISRLDYERHIAKVSGRVNNKAKGVICV